MAQANILSVSGTVTQVASPASVVVNSGLESDTTAFVFAEKQNVTLASAISVDAKVPTWTAGTIAAGTNVSSYYYHSDKVGQGGAATYISTIVFDTDILGIAAADGTLDASDVLGAVGTTYGHNRGFELGSGSGSDSFQVLIDGRTLTIMNTTSSLSDDLRIITAVPEPGALWLAVAALGGLGLTRSHRKVG